MLNVLITGAGGQLGQALCRLADVSPNNYTPTGSKDLDIADSAAVEKAVAELKPDVIVNCAAYTDVERAEEDEAAALRINGTAVANLAAAATRHGALLIHVSTDYVFDGRSSTPYREDTPMNPQNAYGRTKVAGEEAVRKSECRHLIIRTSWLYSETGKNFLKTMLRLTAERETLNVVCDQTGTPTYAGDLALAIFSIIEGGLHTGNEGTYHFSNEGVCSWYDFATEIAAAAGNDTCRIRPCRTEEYPTKAVRPAYTVLDKSKIKETFGLEIPHWRESMRYCLQRLKNNSEP
ncbi:MAG: dTDP-4-dehydrorhamnose reductase [Bacteroides cellulosilyticus]|nr:dTDP-4-dehydrorhamnose reductase [Bacteroides cellulosilyticus]